MASALAVIHAKGLVHLDLKPDNIYVLNGVYKLGDFGRATRADGSMDIEEGDSRYMPLEMLNDDYSQLPKVDMFALGATIYELARGSPLPTSGSQFQTLRQGKLMLLPGYSLSFQNIIKVRPLYCLLYITSFLSPNHSGHAARQFKSLENLVLLYHSNDSMFCRH